MSKDYFPVPVLFLMYGDETNGWLIIVLMGYMSQPHAWVGVQLFWRTTF